MTILAIIGPEHYDDLDYQVWQWIAADGSGGQGVAIVSSKKWYSIDPVGSTSSGIYGYYRSLTGDPPHLLIPFDFYLPSPTGFDKTTSIFELSTGTAGTLSRRLVINNSEKFGIIDTNEKSIGTMSSAISFDTIYHCLWLVDVAGTTRDMFWITSGSSLGTAVIDVTNHGAASPSSHDNLALGSYFSKTLPTEGGPFYVRQGACIDLDTGPNKAALGSVKVVVKMPNGLGADQDFDSGSPAFGDVDEIPYNTTDYDEADAVNEKSSYTLANADGGDVPLAVQPIGAKIRSVGSNSILSRPYLLHSGTRDYAPTSGAAATYRGISANDDNSIWNQINGVAWDATKFNASEIGLEVTTLTANDELRLSQIGVEYVVEGALALPSDFPILRRTHRTFF